MNQTSDMLKARTAVFLLVGMLFPFGCTQTEPASDTPIVEQDAELPGVACDFDESISLATADRLPLDTEVNGRICPVQDQDWYRFNIGTNDRIDVQLRMTNEFSAVVPNYAIVTAEGESVAQGQARNGVAEGRHCVGPGDFALVVRDATDARQDLRNDYSLTVTAGEEPDALEPNNDKDTATGLAPNASKSGLIACNGDEDWYRFDVDERYILELRLEMPVGAIQPRLELIDPEGTTILQLVNGAGSREATDLRKTIALESVGTYFVRVTDNDQKDTDLETPYSLRFSLERDEDVNEPNNEPIQATALGEGRCGDDWSEWVEFDGTFGTGGDVDWFKMPLTGCDPGLIEAEVVYNTDGLTEGQAATIQAAIAMIRPHAPTPCEVDEDCREIQRDCEDFGSEVSWDCAGYGHNCGPNGKCAGVGACLAEGVCGALQVQRKYDPDRARNDMEEPIPHSARLIAPIFGDDFVYLRVSDFGGDGFAPMNFYQLRVRVRAEPDTREPNNVYMNTITRRSQPTGRNLNIATNNVVPIHLCGGTPNGSCEEQLPACSNQADDDLDQLTDWPNDPGCSSLNDENEDDPPNFDNLPCSDGRDNDGDGQIDFPNDLDCVSASWRNEADPICPAGVEVIRVERETLQVEGRLGDSSVFRGTCGGGDGREAVYLLTLSYPGELQVDLDADFQGAVYLLWDCSEFSEEIACGNNEDGLTAEVGGPGVYVLVVDSIDGVGDFTLNISRPTAPEPCQDEMVVPDPNEGAGEQTDGHDDGDAGPADAGINDAGNVDMDAGALEQDAGVPDASPPDAGPRDADILDATVRDASAPDAGALRDAVPLDAAAPVDSAVADASPPEDATPLDAAIDAAIDAGVVADVGAPAPPNFVNHCCGTEETDWIEGYLSYELDQDWYAYPHPCPGEDCMVRIVYQIDGGPVDHLFQVFADRRLWFDGFIPVSESADNRPAVGGFGGLTRNDQCFYAFQGHERQYYIMSVRDLLPVTDYSTDQRYRFCIEKVGDGCSAPPCERSEVTNAAGEVVREECNVP